MTSEHEREPWIPARARLVEVLIDEHQKAVLRELACIGIRLSSWAELNDEAADNAIDRLDGEEAAYYWILRHGAESLPRRAFPISILGADRIYLTESSELGEYQEIVERERNMLTHGESFKAGVDSRVRYLDVQLEHDGKDGGEARIFMAPDMPPVAVHWDDMMYVNRVGMADQDALGVVDRVAEAFGEESVQYLSDEVCELLIAAVRVTPTSFPKGPWDSAR